MKDCLGKELNIGDKVVYLSHSRTSSHLHRAVVTGFTPMKVRLKHVKADGSLRWDELKSPDKIVKVEWSND